MACVLQEQAFERTRGLSALQMSFWSSLYGTLLNVLSIPLTGIPGLLYTSRGPLFPHGASFSQVLSHQGDAVRCFFEREPLPSGCEPGVWLPVILYSASYGINVVTAMMLVREVDALTAVLIGAIVVPATAFAAAQPVALALYGIQAENITEVNWHTVIGSVVVVSGMLVYSRESFCKSQKSQNLEGYQRVQPS